MPNPFELGSRYYGGGQGNLPARPPQSAIGYGGMTGGSNGGGSWQVSGPPTPPGMTQNNPVLQQGPAPTQYGYAQAPGGAYGYYEQQTPAGSFAAANQQWAQGQQSQGQNPLQAQGAQNPYIGQNSQGIQGQGSVMPYAQQIAQQSQKANPYLGGQTQQAQSAGANPYAGSNPYLGQMIDQVSADVTKNFNNSVRPRLDSLARASGSFGNSAVQEQEQNAYSDLSRNLGNLASGMRFQDYTTQQGLAENSLNRNQANNQFNSGLNAGDLNRNLAGFFTGQNLGMQGMGQQLGAAQFDSSLGNNVNQFNSTLGANDIGRNANLAQNMGQFNAGQYNNMGQFNAQLGQNNNQFNAGQGNAMSQFNAGQGNALNQFNTGAANHMLDRFQQNDQFNQGMDFNTWQANTANMRNGQNDQLNFLNSLMGWNNLGLNTANQQRNQPVVDWQTFLNAATQAGGLGGSSSQNLQGNQLMGGLGGWLAMANLLNGGQPRTGG